MDNFLRSERILDKTGQIQSFWKRLRILWPGKLEKHFKNDYIICLFNESKEMSSAELALSRVMLLEQIYRSLMIIKGRQYAK